jgi:hypothetical protein
MAHRKKGNKKLGGKRRKLTVAGAHLGAHMKKTGKKGGRKRGRGRKRA